MLLCRNEEKITLVLKEVLIHEAKESRETLTTELKSNRQELLGYINNFQLSVQESINKLNEIQRISIDSLLSKTEQKLMNIEQTIKQDNFTNRDELGKSLGAFSTQFQNNVQQFNELQREKFSEMALQQKQLVASTEIQLEKMRETVDEKLHKTLEERLGQSFNMVSEQLQAVQKGLGEMQSLANGVGDLKKVLTNVKTRGILGEIQLSNILEQILAPEQYIANAKTGNSNNYVEYCIKLPGKDDINGEVLLPVDAKFPQEDYVRLQDAYDIGDKDAIEKASNALKSAIKSFAKDIHSKYINPPHTTDFGIMFLPVEGLYAEVARHPDLLSTLQRDYKIIITGPTTLAAMLNSLQMGFKTLAIQKRSSEVWTILSEVKREFSKFGDVLVKAQKKISDANNDIDTLVGTRTKSMLRKLNKVDSIPALTEPENLIGEIIDDEIE